MLQLLILEFLPWSWWFVTEVISKSLQCISRVYNSQDLAVPPKLPVEVRRHTQTYPFSTVVVFLRWDRKKAMKIMWSNSPVSTSFMKNARVPTKTLSLLWLSRLERKWLLFHPQRLNCRTLDVRDDGKRRGLWSDIPTSSQWKCWLHLE
jgi:hypothetical protein